MKSLKALRGEMNLTQRDLAINAGIGCTTLRNIEQRRTLPQADVRRRLELVLNSRIDWVLTCGISDIEEITWEDAELLLRKALINIAGLKQIDRKPFIKVAKQYIESIEFLLREKEKGMIAPNEIRAIKPIRSHNKSNRKGK